MEYSIARNNNIFTITKLDNNSIVHVTVFIKQNCNVDVWEVLIPNQIVTSTTVITLPNIDGLYRIQTYFESQNTTYKNLIVPIYDTLLTSFVKNIKEVLCGCPCIDCDCNEEKNYLSSVLKLLSYNIVTLGTYNKFLTASNDCVKCNVLDTNQCNLTHEMILGNYDNTILMKQLIAYYYLVFFYTDVRISNNIDLIKSKYNYNELIPCVLKTGINEECIRTSVLGNVSGIFTQEFNNIFN